MSGTLSLIPGLALTLFTQNISMDTSRCFAFLHDGVIYYSPNCDRHVIVPPRTDPNRYQFAKENARLDRFQHPQWWTRPYGYLAFVPLIPYFDGTIFGCLREIVAHVYPWEYDGKFALRPEKAAEWKDLEDLLLFVVALLKDNKKYLLGPSLNPVAPSCLGYHLPCNTLRAARLRVLTGRDWFVIWMGQLSFLLGHFEGVHHTEPIPQWFSYLESQGITQFWLSSLQASTVCDFSRNCPRVGVFLDFLENFKEGQPKVEWYTSLNVPVWYPWTAQHQKAVKEHPNLAYLQPPPEVLQAAASFIIRTPTAILPSALLPSLYSVQLQFREAFSSHANLAQPQFRESFSPPSFLEDEQPYQGTPPDGSTASHMTSNNHRASQDAHIATKPWLKFFQLHDERNKKKLEKETMPQRQTRLNRESKPPVRKVDVFLWDWSDEDPQQLVRTKVARREGEDILSSYPNSQLVYDSYSNVWDACKYFGPNDDSDDESVVGCEIPPAGTALTHVPIPSPTADDSGSLELAEHEAFHQARIRHLYAAPPSERFKKLFLSYSLDTRSKLDLTQDTFDILGYLAFHYGFVPPLPLPPNSPVEDKDWEENIKNVGLDAGKNPPPPDLAGPILNFLKGCRLPTGPSPELWDLRPGNRRELRAEFLTQIILKKNDNLFFLSPPALREEPSCPWTIALTRAADALFVYRLLMEKDFSPLSLAYVLVNEGIRFCTLQPLLHLSVLSSIRTVRAVIPICVKDYQFNVSDYHCYIQERARLLSSPRGRAALLEGGIVGRIAKEHLGHDCAALGPSSAVTVHRNGFSLMDAGVTYWDDKLTDDEIHIICGLYYCYTGMRHRISQHIYTYIQVNSR